ncbi:hypothetical protein EJ05DRAFT_276837 [Pseudovirgaria hyperparasitica]|uniref:Uncharacterized protein n=1 Tax=Pseudovirgaria hyperparasitica TaxID=470096 RepID=A0A6A6WDW2_9PEZI|nr:uncharacterized protein EJ05DRAFT_276837 [Pseudovirgaria hyperparasitica]KAF2760244.1 hypothetical protein EJ05DRAFT_276837 [Pseudovirgaria hyperparasitica]
MFCPQVYDMNTSELTKFLEPLKHGPSWTAKCIGKLLDADNITHVADGLVGENGVKPVQYVRGVWDIWGVDLPTCYQYCSRSQFPMVFDFLNFSSGVTNYLLPWLGLTAQLPYEAGDYFENIMSFCLSVGSPSLSTFSLMSTALSSHRTHKRFAITIDRSRSEASKEAAKAARDFLRNAQQSSLRINDMDFYTLIVKSDARFQNWWVTIRKRLHKTRRLYTLSLVAQSFFAVAAWVLTIAASYIQSLGMHSQALLLSSGTLWVWLVPVVLGWVYVGTQSREGTIKEALQGQDDEKVAAALETRSGLCHEIEFHPPDSCFGSVIGDERVQGPAFNYARTFTHHRLVDIVATSLEKRAAMPDVVFQRADLDAYIEWADLWQDSSWVAHFLFANAVALFLQWGVTGAATVISYLTEVRGLGCRSGSYLLYGILATSAHGLLLTSAFLSHWAMLIYQRKAENVHNYRRYGTHSVICVLAVLTRYLGRILAVLNALWIILSSIFELIGFYESCWCTGTVLGLGKRAWVVLFVSGDRMREDAAPSWAGGIAMSILAGAITYLIVWMASRERKG